MYKVILKTSYGENSTLEYTTAKGAAQAAQYWAKRGCKILAVQIYNAA